MQKHLLLWAQGSKVQMGFHFQICDFLIGNHYLGNAKLRVSMGPKPSLNPQKIKWYMCKVFQCPRGEWVLYGTAETAVFGAFFYFSHGYHRLGFDVNSIFYVPISHIGNALYMCLGNRK